MKARMTAILVGGLALGLAVPGIAGAAPAGNGASVVMEQNGVPTHVLCGGQDIYLVASGFAPNRKTVQVTLQQQPGGAIETVTIPLSDGSGSLDIGSDRVPLTYKLRARFQTGSSSNPANFGSYSAEMEICGVIG